MTPKQEEGRERQRVGGYERCVLNALLNEARDDVMSGEEEQKDEGQH